MPKRPHQILVPLLNVLLVAALLFIHIRLYRYGYDDAYIHFRVARNFYETGRPYFNVGEAVKVSTSSAWTLLLTLLYAASSLMKRSDLFPAVVAVWNALATALASFAAVSLFKHLTPRTSSIWIKLALGVACIASLLPASIGMMETPTALLLALAGILLLVKEGQTGFIVLGIAVYFRLELLVLIPLAWAFTFLQGSFKLRSIIFSLTGLLPFLIYDLYFFGTVVPQSIHAKNIVYQIHWLATLLDILTSPAALLRIEPYQNIIAGLGIYFFLLFLIGITISIVAQARQKRYSWSALYAIWSLAVILGYTVGHAFVFGWYLPLFLVPGALAGAGFVQQSERNGAALIRLSGCFMLALQFMGIGQTVVAAMINPSIYANFAEGARVRQYLSVGESLYKAYPQATLLSSEIGALGYSFPGYIYDAAGLASPRALAYHPLPYPAERPNGYIGAIPPKFVVETKPGIIVSYDIFAQALLNSPYIAGYQNLKLPVFRVDDLQLSHMNTIWNSSSLHVLIRKDLSLERWSIPQ